jgi:hypothetical protein
LKCVLIGKKWGKPVVGIDGMTTTKESQAVMRRDVRGVPEKATSGTVPIRLQILV